MPSWPCGRDRELAGAHRRGVSGDGGHADGVRRRRPLGVHRVRAAPAPAPARRGARPLAAAPPRDRGGVRPGARRAHAREVAARGAPAQDPCHQAHVPRRAARSPERRRAQRHVRLRRRARDRVRDRDHVRLRPHLVRPGGRPHDRSGRRDVRRLRRGHGARTDARRVAVGKEGQSPFMVKRDSPPLSKIAESARIARRRASVPAITYPPRLPVAERKDDLLAAIRDNQVVVVAGETGSGKTTQLPKICLELGRGVEGMIAHTQPRRLAARTVAERIAFELNVPLGAAVGYAVRFSDRTRPETLVRLMTDGLLLAETQRDRRLRRYDTIIVDEAHERSLNIDFLLGYLARLLPRRPDLKLIITSATIDPQRFSRHFGDAPVVEVSGRTYPVEVRYRPLADDDDADQTDAIGDAVDELLREASGDVL